MRNSHRLRVTATMLVVLLSSALSACVNSEAPLTAPGEARLANGSDDPNFLAASPGTAPAAPVTFWAKQGEDRTGEIMAAGGTSGGNGDRLVRLRIRKDAQIVLPNGIALTPGDSVQITMQIIDPVTLNTQFEPSGLRFNGKKVAQLTMWYGRTNASMMPSLEKRLSIFMQESAAEPWRKVSSTVSAELDEVQGYIGGFTNYVIAY
jgi:hypothetical protein